MQGQQLGQPLLIDRNTAGLQSFHFGPVIVYADHRVTKFGKRNCSDQSDVAGANDRNG
jgi:hypothetical protein